MTAPVLAVEDLEKHFGGGGWFGGEPPVRAVDGVSFEIGRGETLGLIGESGSGKSTIAKTVIGIHEPTGGRIRFQGEDVTPQTRKQLRRLRSEVQMVFQDPTSCLNPRRTIRKSLSVPLQAADVPKGQRANRVSELLDRVGLNDEYLAKYPHELSGGQKQRVNIARAIAVEPTLLLLDEPTSALDVSVQAKIIGLLEDLQDELGLTYLFITHDLSLVRNFADETAVMYLGEIQERGPTDRIFERPSHPYTRALLSAIPVTDDAEEAYKPRQEPLEGEIPSPRDVPSGCRFHPRCPHATEQCAQHHPEPREVDGASVRCLAYDDGTSGFDDLPSEPRRLASDGGVDR
ncbi:peptide ABC transporter ATPase [Halosimplex carlsbadense 2-9-1]|uniref:Peptide ABC transporter ATPase n=1 Tax=Halosimplex carlsbadense 2-9-1 TaxID=797114 RepID=M0D6W0_9EURY|nr:ABC transporter ATP-binding protein [Halosimplex carlsbadense]ELZ30548.1 peptide ABC transporter ATPase [Halosimplex carlsbadense 2-9-1]